MEEAQIRSEERLAKLEEAQIRSEERMARLEEVVVELVQAQRRMQDEFSRRFDLFQRTQERFAQIVGATAEARMVPAVKGWLESSGLRVLDPILAWSLDGLTEFDGVTRAEGTQGVVWVLVSAKVRAQSGDVYDLAHALRREEVRRRLREEGVGAPVLPVWRGRRGWVWSSKARTGWWIHGPCRSWSGSAETRAGLRPPAGLGEGAGPALHRVAVPGLLPCRAALQVLHSGDGATVRKLRRVDPRRSAEALDKIRAYRDRVVERLRPRCVLLFGSFARGDVHEGSDVDVLVVADFAVPFLDRIRLLLDLNDGIGLPLEPVGYTPEEFRHMRETGNRFVQEVLETGQVLYGDI